MSSEPVESFVHDPASARSPLPPEYVRSELTLHTIFIAMAGVVLLMSILMTSQGDSAVYLPGFHSPLPDTCTSRRLLGVDCPGCGMTRAFISISKGQLARAWQLNPASFAVYLFVALQIPWHAVQIWLLRTKRRPIEWTWIYMTPIAVVVLLMANWFWKLILMVS